MHMHKRCDAQATTAQSQLGIKHGIKVFFIYKFLFWGTDSTRCVLALLISRSETFVHYSLSSQRKSVYVLVLVAHTLCSLPKSAGGPQTVTRCVCLFVCFPPIWPCSNWWFKCCLKHVIIWATENALHIAFIWWFKWIYETFKIWFRIISISVLKLVKILSIP